MKADPRTLRAGRLSRVPTIDRFARFGYDEGMETTNTNRARAIIGARLIVATAATVAAWSTGASATGLPSTDWPTCPATILVADGAPISCDLDGRQTLSLVHVNRATCDHAGGRFVIVPNRAAVCADVDY